MQNKKICVRNEDGSYPWRGGREWCLGNILLWAAGNIHLMTYQVVILMCLFSDDLLASMLKLCAVVVCPMSTQKFKKQFLNLTGEYMEQKYMRTNHNQTYI